jgi:predicted metal-dependent TIM-barrel fold hydrolase
MGNKTPPYPTISMNDLKTNRAEEIFIHVEKIIAIEVFLNEHCRLKSKMLVGIFFKALPQNISTQHYEPEESESPSHIR